MMNWLSAYSPFGIGSLLLEDDLDFYFVFHFRFGIPSLQKVLGLLFHFHVFVMLENRIG